MVRAVRRLMLLSAVGAILSGCGAFDKFTGQVDDTVLPGQREDAVPGRSQFPDKAEGPVTQGSDTSAEPEQAPSSPCAADDPACQPSSDGVFSDPQ
ncbi:MAG: hypothetical protein KDK89_11435 [Alphaproteobacteria bacterium]|nr:hypothetical protein [Alphaproteobacteria bacterium]